MSCPDCGTAPTNHLLAKLDVVIDEGIERLQRRFGWLERLSEPFMYWVGNNIVPKIFRVAASLGIGKIMTTPDETIEPRARCLWDEANRRGIKMSAYQLVQKGARVYMATHNNANITFDMVPRPGNRDSSSVFWMDNKHTMRKEFGSRGIPVAKGGVVRTQKEALRLFQTLTPPVIAKPIRGSRSRHTTTHIESASELHRAVEVAKVVSPWVVIEEELVGLVHRGTVIGGKVIGVLRREPASVVGDGVHTVMQLIEKINADPRRDGKIFHKIEIHDPEHDKELAHQHLSLKSVPEQGQLVVLSQKASRGLGGGATDVTDEAHPDNIALLEKIGEVLNDPLVGVDFIIGDVTRSWKEQARCGIIECNSAPFIDLHLYPLTGKPRDTAGALWDLVFPTSRRM
ncbi:MAG: Cyanophycin synthetase [Candidatus Parcubacteria bacterium]